MQTDFAEVIAMRAFDNTAHEERLPSCPGEAH
jgi:hypothetical protein